MENTQHTAEKDAPVDYPTWRYQTWGARTATVVAYSVEFTATHVVWRDAEGSVVLAERPENVNELAQVGTLGSATRGVRPADGSKP